MEKQAPVFKKLRNSMMLFNVLTVSLVMLAAFTTIYLVMQGNVQRENTRRLQAASGMYLMPGLAVRAPAAGARPAGERFAADYGGSFALLVKDGQLAEVSSQLDLDEDTYAQALTQADGARRGEITLEGRRWLFRAVEPPAGAPGSSASTYLVFLDISHSVRILRSLLLTLGVAGTAVLLALWLISYRFAARAVRPIEENYNKQKQFIADASHEFRTPLAVIGANVDAITASGEETVDSQQEWFGYIRTELKRAGKLVDDLLDLARSEQVRADAQGLPFDLSTACETAAATMEAMLFENGITLASDIQKGVTVLGDGRRLGGVIYNLLDNAGKYTPQGGCITMTLGMENDRAVLRVSNTGEDIPAADLPRLFDRFYRADASRTTQTGGSGLGLSIAKTVVENAGGSIGVQSGGGVTTFIVTLRPAKG